MAIQSIKVVVQEAAYNMPFEEKKLLEASGSVGALVTFQGMVREFDYDSALNALELEYFPKVTEKEIERIIHEADNRWEIEGCTVIHRVGRLEANDPIVLLMVTSKHRKDAFEAAEFIMDYLKTNAPFWKKEHFDDGQSAWVEAKASDAERAERWAKKD